jgi:hypothetical protein
MDMDFEGKVVSVAKEFSRLLAGHLGDDLAVAVQSNRDETCEGVCHTHDYCDANMVMDEAMRNCGIDPDLARDEDGEPVEPFDTEFTNLWNAAWDLAKGVEFDEDKIEEAAR